ncbi:hypothetical protein D3C72_1134300 [compost metagenome]
MWNLPDDLVRTLNQLTRPTPQPPAAPTPAPAPKPEPPPKMEPDTLALQVPMTGAPRAAGPGAAIALQNVKSGWVKDPTFVADGRKIGGQRYMAFGDLRNFHLKAFDVRGKGLEFKNGEVPIKIAGIPDKLDGRWAPQITVQGDRVIMLYCAGEMHPGEGINWPSFRMRTASVPLDEFAKAAKGGKPVTFKDHGVLFPDQTNFGGDSDFAMIDPHLHNTPDGKAFMTYTVVKAGIPGKRSHEEFIRIREVDPKNPAKAIGPDTPLVDGWAGAPHHGVAEAQELVTIGGKQFLFISSRAGDIDQKVLVAPYKPGDKVPLPPSAFKPVMNPGGEGWKANAVGSTSTAVIEGKPYMLHQGLNSDKRFTLGWTSLALDG